MLLGIVAIAAVAAQAPASGTMTTDQYIAHWKAIEKAMAVDMAAIVAETKDGIVAYKADVAAAQVGGQPKRGCLPAEGSAQLDARTVVTAMQALPAAERAGPFRQALFAYLDRTYPCPPAAK